MKKKIPDPIKLISGQLMILDKILSHVSPLEALKIIFTPENVQAASYGATKAYMEANKEE